MPFSGDEFNNDPNRRYASIEALNQLSDGVKELRADIKELRGWLVGRVDDNGKPIPGVLQTINELRNAKGWVLGLLGLIATSTCINALTNIVQHWLGSLK